MNTFTTIYRTGGTERCEWRRCLPVATRLEAVMQRDDIERGGHKALVMHTEALNTLGMPEGWEA